MPRYFLRHQELNTYYTIFICGKTHFENCYNFTDIYFIKVFFSRCYDMLAMFPRLKTSPPHQISSYLTLTKKQISNVFVKGIFRYLLRAPLKVDTYNYVSTSITKSFSFTGSLVVTSKSSCALTKGQNSKAKKKNFHVP
jgi:hypothetical protein